MTAACSANAAGDRSCDVAGSAASRGPADWLSLAAAPTFAIMALLAAEGGGQPDFLCGDVHHASPLSGMALMYLLMAAFHSAPWLKLISSRAKRLEGN
jgi:hypothetical protein